MSAERYDDADVTVRVTFSADQVFMFRRLGVDVDSPAAFAKAVGGAMCWWAMQRSDEVGL